MHGECTNGCGRWAKWRGLCQRCYIADQYKDKPPPTDAEILQRLLPKIVFHMPLGCWEWQGAKHSRYGHGMFGYNALGKNTTRYVHVWLWENLVGPVPADLQLDHLCRNTRCCNPLHLEPVTARVNNLRGQSSAARNARKTKCIRGHELSGDNLYIRKRGQRQERWCRTCMTSRARERRRSM